MENKNTYMPAVGAGGVSAGGLATELPASRVVIRKFGRGMNSQKPERRYLYLYVDPFDGNDLDTGIRKAVDAINKLLIVWEPPTRRGFFRQDMWWEHVACQRCLRRMEYEVKKWQAGEYVWRRNTCLRHWMVYHLTAVSPGEPSDLISNRPISVVATATEILYNIETVNYKYSVSATKEVAEMEVVYKGRMHRFSFRNHLRGYPYNSSYMNILIDVFNTLELFRDFLVDYVSKRRVRANTIINDVFTIPPARDDVVGCDVCRL